MTRVSAACLESVWAACRSICIPLCATLSWIACGESTGPSDPAHNLLLTSDGDARGLAFVVAETGEVETRLALQGRIEGVGMSPDSTTAYVGLVDDGGTRFLAAVDVPNQRLNWRRRLPSTGTSPHDTAVLSAATIGISADGAQGYLWYSEAAGVSGLARVSLGNNSINGFTGPFATVNHDPITIRSGGGDAVALIGSRDAGLRRNQQVFILRPTLEVFDSISREQLGVTASASLLQIISGLAQNTVLIITSEGILNYDLVQRRIVARVTQDVRGSAVLTRSGVLVITDPGVFPDFPGSGVLHLFTETLQPLGTIDVSTPIGGHPNSTQATRTTMATSFAHNPNLVFVKAGSEGLGPLYPLQTAKILVVDVVSKTFIRKIDLEGYGGAFIKAASGR